MQIEAKHPLRELRKRLLIGRVMLSAMKEFGPEVGWWAALAATEILHHRETYHGLNPTFVDLANAAVRSQYEKFKIDGDEEKARVLVWKERLECSLRLLAKAEEDTPPIR